MFSRVINDVPHKEIHSINIVYLQMKPYFLQRIEMFSPPSNYNGVQDTTKCITFI
jgi:hypothetical protein